MEYSIRRRTFVGAGLAAFIAGRASAQPVFRLGLTPVFLDNDAAVIDGLRRAFTLEILARNDHEIGSLRSKHLSEYQTAEAPVMDFVFTVCDSAAAEECPPWPGQPISGHWGLPDPVKATGTEAEKGLVFAQTYAGLRRRIAAFTALPLAQLDRIALQRDIDKIGLDQT